jgi:hypothetical protein
MKTAGFEVGEADRAELAAWLRMWRLAKEVGVSSMTVHRIWHKYGLQPHRIESFKFSTDTEFDAKLADIVGLRVDPPERALVLCVDEKSQTQGLVRAQPMLADVARTARPHDP